MGMKRLIAEDLAQKESQLNSNQFGKFVATKCAISAWKHSNSEWNSIVTNSDRTKNMFSDILGDNVKVAVKRKVNEPVAKTIDTEEKKPKKEVTELVEEMLKDTSPASEVKKKKKKSKSYLDDL